MIGTFAVALLVFALAMAGMAFGALAGRRGLGAGCAALGTAGDEASACQVCGRPAGSDACSGAAHQPNPEKT